MNDNKQRIACSQKSIKALTLSLMLCAVTGQHLYAVDSAIKPSEQRLGNAQVSLDSAKLKVTTGVVTREWTWTESGWQTSSLQNTNGKEYCLDGARKKADWSIPGLKGKAELQDVVVTESNDDGFTSSHLQVVSTLKYPDANLLLRHIVWVLPDAPGIRVQLQLKAMPGFDAKKMDFSDQSKKSSGSTFLYPGAIVDSIPLDVSIQNERHYWGYYNDPGNRPFPSKDMLREQKVTGFPVFQNEVIDWASGAVVQYGDQGVVLVKESPKTVNEPAHLTGSFCVSPEGLANSGTGLSPQEIVEDRYRDCWATWSILYQNGEDGLQTALKQFEAIRYPVYPERDMFIMCNGWHAILKNPRASTEESWVIDEIKAAADLGVDVVQIDDGWQTSRGSIHARKFRPRYADGWTNIKKALDEHQIRLGLWVAIRNVTMDEFKRNLDQLDFVSWKADFDVLKNRTDYENRISQLRAVMKCDWMNTQFTICPEYDDPRYGWYFMSEYGSHYFQNIKQVRPKHLVLVPFQVLRKHWQMAKYLPTNKLQVMLQDPKKIPTEFSDASEHSHAYCFAMGLPFVPVMLYGVQLIEESDTKELKTLIAQYKEHREEMFTGITYPIGEEPSNASWAGFQTVSKSGNSGYLLIFRELRNEDSNKTMTLKFLANKTLTITNLRTNEVRKTKADQHGNVAFEIDNPAEFLFLRYEMNGSE